MLHRTNSKALPAFIFIAIFFFSAVVYFLLINAPKNINKGEAILLGDCNTDNRVDILDFQSLSNSFGKTTGQAGYNPNCNFNGDSQINILDFQILSNNFGSTGASPTPPPASLSCLNQTGPLITLSGERTSYRNRNFANTTRVDARTAVFRNGGENPVDIGGGTDICWYGGKIFGGYPLNTDWHTTHPTAGIEIHDGTFRFTIERVYIDQIGDGIKVRLGETSGLSGNSQPFTVRGVWLKDIRDDCIESDWQASAVIEDSLLDGCYVAFATKKRDGDSINGSQNIWKIRNSLVYLHDQIGVYRGTTPGHGLFFKWDDTSPKYEIHNTILRIDSNSSFSSDALNLRLNKLINCSNNKMVWLGEGNYPGSLPSCFSVTTDKSVWDSAVSAWKLRNGF